MAAAIRKMFGRGGVPSDAKRGSVASSLDENCLEGWVWKQKRNTAMVPGYRKVYATIALEPPLELTLSRKMDAPPEKCQLITVLPNDGTVMATKAQTLSCALLPPVIIGMRVGLGFVGPSMMGKKAYGLKVQTVHRNLHLFFEEEAERDRWFQKIIAAQGSETVSPRKSTVKSLLEGLNLGRTVTFEPEKHEATDKPGSKTVSEGAESTGSGSARGKRKTPAGNALSDVGTQEPAGSSPDLAPTTTESPKQVEAADESEKKPEQTTPATTSTLAMESVGFPEPKTKPNSDPRRRSTVPTAEQLLAHQLAEVPASLEPGDDAAGAAGGVELGGCGYRGCGCF